MTFQEYIVTLLREQRLTIVRAVEGREERVVKGIEVVDHGQSWGVAWGWGDVCTGLTEKEAKRRAHWLEGKVEETVRNAAGTVTNNKDVPSVGQVAYTLLEHVRPDLAKRVATNPQIDPRNNEDLLGDFITFLMEKWDFVIPKYVTLPVREAGSRGALRLELVKMAEANEALVETEGSDVKFTFPDKERLRDFLEYIKDLDLLPIGTEYSLVKNTFILRV